MLVIIEVFSRVVFLKKLGKKWIEKKGWKERKRKGDKMRKKTGKKKMNA